MGTRTVTTYHCPRCGANLAPWFIPTVDPNEPCPHCGVPVRRTGAAFAAHWSGCFGRYGMLGGVTLGVSSAVGITLLSGAPGGAICCLPIVGLIAGAIGMSIVGWVVGWIIASNKGMPWR
jgi:endogenous inhibitor of DNA gyrase (YacG/DUF329 family)